MRIRFTLWQSQICLVRDAPMTLPYFILHNTVSLSSLEGNREMGMILNHPTDISVLQAQFARDWKAAEAA
ncbi:hypothetical protein C3R74_13265 [Acidithiobacillus ferridurans]|nr:hypothetical protein C3R74_13265 [Acidithiobacillus ferridurans]